MKVSNELKAIMRSLIEQQIFLDAVWKGDDSTVALLINENDVDVCWRDRYGHTPLHLASQKGYVEIARLLIDSDCRAIHMKANSGRTPLHSACEGGHSQVVALLLDMDVALNSKDKWGRTPLYLASWYNRFDVVRLLVEKYYAKVGIKDEKGKTAQDKACEAGHKDIANYFVQEHQWAPFCRRQAFFWLLYDWRPIR